MPSNEITHGFIETNGIRMHYVESGKGPLVVLLHGFPECWYSWRHQLEPLAGAGFHVVAPDLRGYGQTGRPKQVEAYDIFQLTGDIVGLVHAFGQTTAVLVGHDWGAWIAAHLALFRPDMVAKLALLSVPYVPRRTINQTRWEQQTYPGKLFYQAILRSPMADRYFLADVRTSLLRGLYTMSAQASEADRFPSVIDPGIQLPPAPAIRPPWISEADLDFVEAEFRRSGFTGGLNYYRNMDRNWAMTPFLDGAKILQPALFAGGDKDPVMDFHRQEFDDLKINIPNLARTLLLPDVGHWIQQEVPEAVNRLLIDFL